MFLRKRLQCLRPSSHYYSTTAPVFDRSPSSHYYSTTAPVFDRREERRRVHRERRERRIAARETKHDNDDNAAAVENPLPSEPLPSEPLPSEPPGIEEAAARGGVNSDVYKTSKSDDEEAAEAKRFWMTTRKLFRNVLNRGNEGWLGAIENAIENALENEKAAAAARVNSDVYKTSKSDDEEAAEAKRFWMTTRKLFRNVCITGAIFCVTCDATDLFDCKQVLRPLLGL